MKTKKGGAGRPIKSVTGKLRTRVLYSLDPAILELFNKMTKKKNRSEIIESFMRAYVAEHGQDPL